MCHSNDINCQSLMWTASQDMSTNDACSSQINPLFWRHSKHYDFLGKRNPTLNEMWHRRFLFCFAFVSSRVTGSVALNSCANKWRSWKACIEGIERCEAGYCVLQLWFVMLTALLVLMFNAAFISLTYTFFDKLANVAFTVTTLLCISSLGVLIVGNTYAYM